MKEEFLHFVWKYRLYDSDRLVDTEGNTIVVFSPGEYNRDSGPDFFNARVRIGETMWIGNAEVHLNSSDWYRHGHHTDHAYNNVVLHIVANADRQAVTASGLVVPEVMLSIPETVYRKYLEYVNNPLLIACQNDLHRVDRYLMTHWLSCLAIERLQAKTETIEKSLTATGKDWEESLYRLVARYFGARVNTDNFEMLARDLPLKLLRKHSDNRLQVEALLYGMAGMLSGELFREAVNDEYFRNLAQEFRVLRSKYSLVPMHGWLWKFHRLRPAGFPTIRLSQLAGLVCRQRPLFSEILEATTAEELNVLLDNPASDYWRDHYTFGKGSAKRSGHAGGAVIDVLIINVIVPMLFVYGRNRDHRLYCDRAVSLLEQLKPEDNRITSEWKRLGVDAANASDSQALNQLLNEYCRKKRCLECRNGQKLISMGMTPAPDHNTLLERDSCR